MSSIRASKVYFTSAIARASLVFVPLLVLLELETKASAQVISADDEASTEVEVVGNLININGGQISGDRTNLFQSFEQFDLAPEQTANFVTTPEIHNVVSRVNGGRASTIDGTLQVSGSNANLYLMNPAGILLGPNAQLNLSGGFTATTATGIGFAGGQFNAVGNSAYSNLSGDPTIFRFDNAQAGAVVNAGDLGVQAGKAITLVGGTVVNVGNLSAPAGTVTLAAVEGENLIRISQGDQLLSLEVEASNLSSPASGKITRQITGQSIGEMLTGGGLTQATALITEPDGSIRLGGTQIDESGGEVIASGRLSTVGDVGGNINVLGDRVTLIDATLDASGNDGGGLIRVGGDYQGHGPLAQATQTSVDANSALSANALINGSGGSVIVWANNNTSFHGELEAKGGSLGGNGGFAEISGKQQLIMDGGIDLSASRGNVGTVLLDPENIVITDGAAPTSTATITYLSSSYVENLSQTADVELAATNDFTIENLSDGKLLFQPGRSVTFTADSDLDGSGAFLMLDAADWIDADRGKISIFGAGINTGQLVTDTTSSNREDAGDVTVISSRGVTINGISTNNYSFGNNAGNGGNVRIEANNGDIVIGGLVKTWSYAVGNNAGSGGEVSLRASGSIAVKDIVTYSRTGNNNADDGGDVSLIANGDITTQSIQTQSIAGRNNSRNSGDIIISSANGSIGTGSILTSNGSVTLNALGDIAIASIDASSTENNTEATLVDISTQGLFTATSEIGATGASISTVGTNDGSITISYDSPDNPFVVGNSSVNGTAGNLQSPTATLASGSFSGNHSEGNIRLINRSSDSEPDSPEPEVDLPEPEVDPPESLKPETELPTSAESEKGKPPLSRGESETAAALLLTSVQNLQESDSRQLSERIQNPTTMKLGELFKTFEKVESGISGEFSEYLHIRSDQQHSASATVATVQETLSAVERATGASPALIYVYFVPNAASEAAAAETESPESDLQQGRAPRADDELEVMVITDNGVPIRQRGWGITREQVEGTIRTLRQQMTSQFSSAQQYLPPAQQLYDWIIAPVEHTLKQENVTSLGFVMDTGLRMLPVAALYDGDRYLVENYSLGLLPSFSLTDINTTTANRVNLQRSRVLAMGASKFRDQPGLPAVDAEVTLISEGLGKGDAFLDEDFVLKTIQSQLEKETYGVLHLATHAVFAPGDPKNSYIQLWDEKLSLNRISELELKDKDIGLVILSACSTALGDQGAEYGFAGLAVSAGSQSALASLWPVSDEGTLGFMSQFYRQLRDAPIRAEALRQAQLSMINGEIGIVDGKIYGPDNQVLVNLPELEQSGQWDFSHPFYWSAFTMIGNPW